MKDLTQGPVVRQLLGMAGFMMIGMVVQTLYSLVDMYWVSRLGAAAQAAVTLSGNVMLIAMALSQMLGVGAGALVAQATGRKDHDAAHQVFNQALGMGLCLMLLFELLFGTAAGPYSRALGADAQTIAYTADYLRWFLPAMALQFPMMAMGSALRGTGNMKPGTIAQVCSVLLNMVLAPLLIFGWLGFPQLGVAGAGLATFLAVVAATLGLSLYFLHPRTYLRVRPREWLPQPAKWWRIMRIGLPSAVEMALMSCYLLFITWMLRPFGASEQAAFGVGQRLLQAGMMPLMAVSFAASAMTGQNYGARLGQRVRDTFAAAMKLNLGFALLMFLLAELCPAAMAGAFTRDPVVLAGAVEFLRVIGLNMVATSAAFACFGVLSGLGNTVPTLIASTTRIVLIVAPAWLLSHQPGFRPLWLWLISVGATLVQMTVNLWFLRRELHKRLGPPDASPAPATVTV